MSTASAHPSEIPPEAKLDEIRVILVGKTGAGKSATGNTIVGEKVFPVNATGLSTASKCQFKKFCKFDKKILLIDTPGVFDTDRSREVIQDEIHNFLLLSAPGPHAIILVTSAAWRFTQEEIDCIRRLQDMFGKGLSNHLFIVITRTEYWDEDGLTANSFLGGLPEEAKAVLKDALDGDRILPFQNTLRGHDGELQVRKLLEMISRHVDKNGGACYTNENWQEAEREMQERIRLLTEKQEKEESEKMEERKRKAVGKVEEEQRKKMEEIQRQHQQEKEEWERQLRERIALEESQMERKLKEEEEKLKREADEAASKAQKPTHASGQLQPKELRYTSVDAPMGTKAKPQPLSPAVTSEPPPGTHRVSEGRKMGSKGRTQTLPRGGEQEQLHGNECMGVENSVVKGKQRHAHSDLQVDAPMGTKAKPQPLSPAVTSEPPPGTHRVSEGGKMGSKGRTQTLPRGGEQEQLHGNERMGVENSVVKGKQRHAHSDLQGEKQQVDSAARSSRMASGPSAGNRTELDGRQRTTSDRGTTPSCETPAIDSGDVETNPEGYRQRETQPSLQESDVLRLVLEHNEKRDEQYERMMVERDKKHERMMVDMMQHFEKEKTEVIRLLQSMHEEKMRDMARQNCTIM